MDITAEVREKAAEILLKARDAMNDSGAHWIQGDWSRLIKYDEKGQPQRAFCSVGAINHVSDAYAQENPDDPNWVVIDNARVAAVIALAQDEVFEGRRASAYGNEDQGGYGASEQKVITYNDDSGRAWEEIDSLFRRTAERLRAGEKGEQ